MHLFRDTASRSIVIVLLLASQLLGQLPNPSTPATKSPQNDEFIDQITPAQIGSSSRQVDPTESSGDDLLNDIDFDLSDIDLSSPLSTQEREMAMAISDKVKATEWLGALGPVAVSPFFGLTCLSAIAILGEDRLPPDHYLRRASTPLRNPLVLLTFLLLTILTSIPKFSKVSKPFAQAVDQLETYSAIVILLVIRVLGGIELSGGEEPQIAMAVVHKAGVIEFSVEALLMIATVANIVVINSVKFFFEIMIWITPIPLIDAMFEASSKAVCVGLAALYAYSPAIATIVNLSMLACCLVVFAWVKRREIYYRTILFDFARSWWNRSSSPPPNDKLIVFPKDRIENIPPMAKCELSKSPDGWLLHMPRWFRKPAEHRWNSDSVQIEVGMLKNKLIVNGHEFHFGKRNVPAMQQLTSALGAHMLESKPAPNDVGNLSAEMA